MTARENVNKLGELKNPELTDVWPKEDDDFTPWLQSNLGKIGAILDLNLKLVEREAAVGRYRADLIAEDEEGNIVVIENQTRTADHDHLGKLITYAAGKKAKVVVWISRDFNDEHLQSIEWLNRLSSDVDFFAVIVELFQVDDSKPAVRFRPIASPNREERQKILKNTSDLNQKYGSLFQALIDELREKHKFTNAKKAQPRNFYSFPSGISHLTYGASFANKKRIRAELYIGGREAKKIFGKLEERKDALSRAFGDKLEWEALEGKEACRIACYRDGSIEDSSKLGEYRAWLVDRLLRFKKVFDSELREAAS